MKKFTLAFGVLLITATILAQVPQSFKYQAIARDLNGDVIPDQDIGLRISILSGSIDGIQVYSETHDLSTNQFGLFTLNIGKGKNNTGNFSDIAWGASTHFVKIEIDKTGGQNYSLLGVSQLLSVPYALYAETSGFSDSSKQANSWTETVDEVFLTDPAKKVGIGNTLPDEKLHVSGNIEIDNGFAIIQNDTNLIRRYQDSYYIGSQNSGGLPLKNTFVGFSSGEGAAYAQENVLLGYQAGRYIGSGDYNTLLGVQAGYNSFNGRYNTYLGYHSGFNATGSYNVFLGYNAGREEGGSNRLYVENSNSSSPLIYGEFDNDLVRINGTLDINNQYQLPTTDGNNGQILKTDGSGNLSWNNDTGADLINDLGDARTGGESVFLGSGAGESDDLTNNQNVALGINALKANISGDNNTSLGHKSMYTNTIGNKNTANGSGALYSNSSGNLNTSLGYHSLYSNTGGSSNTALGETALFYNTTGINNTAVGSGASSFNFTGNSNVAIGRHANFFNQSGINNTIIGYQAGMGMLNTSFSGNIFIGCQAGYNETTSNKLYIENSNSSTPLIYGEFDNDVVVVNGDLGVSVIQPTEKLDVSGNIKASGTLQSGNSIVIDGVNDKITASSGSIFFDDEVLSTTGGFVLGAGSLLPGEKLSIDGDMQLNGSFKDKNGNSGTSGQVLASTVNGTQWMDPSSIGGYAINDLLDAKTDGNSVFLGSDAGANNVGADNQNVALGREALQLNYTSRLNTAVGYSALRMNTAGNANTAVGNKALENNLTGELNTAVGAWALTLNQFGHLNTAIGLYALLENYEGQDNTAIGAFAQMHNTEGNYNTTVGNSANLCNVAGSENTMIGYWAGKGTSPHNKSGNVFIGFMAGYYETGSDKLYIENSDNPNPLVYGEFDNDLVKINGALSVKNGVYINEFSNDVTLAGNSDDALPTEKAVKTYIDNNHKWSGNTHIYYNSGNVSIGTSVSGEELEVMGDIHASGTIISGSSITIDGTGTTQGTITESHGKISFDDENIVTAGKIGIGTDNPSSNLEVIGSIQAEFGTSINEFSADGTLSGDSDNAVPTEKAVKEYIDALEAKLDALQAFVEYLHPVQARLDNGETPFHIYQSNNALLDSLYGKTYQGGLIFYLDIVSGIGYVQANDIHINGHWGCQGIYISGANGLIIGTGEQNTTDMKNQCLTSIAGSLSMITINGYNDWYFPSKDELDAIYTNLKLKGFGNFNNVVHVSSTQIDSNTAWGQDFTNGASTTISKNAVLEFPAIRTVDP